MDLKHYKQLDATSVQVPIFDNNGTTHGDLRLLDGKNITGDEAGLDDAIIKAPDGASQSGDAGFKISFDQPFSYPAFPNFQASLVSNTIPILATGLIDDTGHGVESIGYYQVEINMGIPQKIEGKDGRNNKIQAIVSRYYQSGSFTSSYNEGSISYIHRGAPIELNDFNIRILDPNNNLAQDISNDNAIFLRIIKA